MTVVTLGTLSRPVTQRHAAVQDSAAHMLSSNRLASPLVAFGQQQESSMSLAQGLALKNQVLFGSAYPKLTYRKTGTHVDPLLGTFHLYEFSNGMKFVGLQRKEVPLVSMGELYATGSTSENDDNNGVSHFLEHLIFKGTPNLAPGEFDRQLEDMGTGANAFTWYDETFYYLDNIAKESLPQAIKLRAEIVQNPWIPKAELTKERGVVLEEINEAHDDKEDRLSELLAEMLWSGSSYQRSILGPKSHIKQLSRDEIFSYFAEHYGPNNRTIVMVGDFELKPTLDLIASEYNHPFPPQGTDYPEPLPPTDPFLTPIPPTPKPVAANTLLGEDLDETALTAIGFNGPDPNQPGAQKELVALDLLSIILAPSSTRAEESEEIVLGKSSRLYQALVEQTDLAANVSMYVSAFNNSSAIQLGLKTKPEDFEAAKAMCRSHIENIIANGVTEAELNKAKIVAESLLADLIESNGSILTELATTLGHGSLNNAFGHLLSQIQSMTVEDIQAVAAKYLRPEQAISITMAPKKFVKAQRRQAAPQFGSSQSTSISKLHFGGRLSAEDQSVMLPGGAELIVRNKPSSLKTTICINIKGGDRVSSDTPGLVSYLTKLMQRGTNTETSQAFQERLDQLGLKLGIESNEDAVTITLTGLSRFKAEMFDILTDILHHPDFSASSWSTVKSQYKKKIQAWLDTDPSAVAQQLFSEALFPPEHPLGLTGHRVVEGAKQIHPDQFMPTFQQLISRPNMTLSMVGNITLPEAQEAGERMLTNLPDQPVQVPDIPPIALNHNMVVTKAKAGLDQSVIIRGWPVPGENHPDSAALTMLNAVLSWGTSTRLAQRFREEEEGLCYAVATYYVPTLSGGYFEFEISTDTENTTKVQQYFQEELDKLFQNPPFQEELTRTLKGYKTELLAAKQGTFNVASETARHRGLNTDSYEELIEKLEAVTPEQVQAAAIKYLKRPSLTAVVAPKKVLQAHGLPVNGTATH